MFARNVCTTVCTPLLFFSKTDKVLPHAKERGAAVGGETKTPVFLSCEPARGCPPSLDTCTVCSFRAKVLIPDHSKTTCRLQKSHYFPPSPHSLRAPSEIAGPITAGDGPPSIAFYTHNVNVGCARAREVLGRAWETCGALVYPFVRGHSADSRRRGSCCIPYSLQILVEWCMHC